MIICKQSTKSHFTSLMEAKSQHHRRGNGNEHRTRDTRVASRHSSTNDNNRTKAIHQANCLAMPSPGNILAILLLLTLAIASPATTLEATKSRHLIRQVATTTSLTLLSIPTITIDILQSPYVSLHSITARDAQAPEPTTATPPQIGSIVPAWTVTLSHHEPKPITYGLQTTNVGSALHHWTEVPVAISASSFTQAVDINQTESDCTAICGALNADGGVVESHTALKWKMGR